MLNRSFLAAFVGAVILAVTVVSWPDRADGRTPASTGVVWAAGVPPGPSSRARPAETIGTIRATLDGEERIWYVVSGETEGGRQPGAFWMDLGGSSMAVVGGYDTEEFDFSQIEFQGTTPVSLGDYEGSLLSIAFPVPEEGRGSWTSPSDATVSYMSEAHTMDFSTALMMEEGTVEASRVQLEAPCRFEGRFSGTLRPMGGEGPALELRDGTFTVEGCERFDPTGRP